MKGRLFILFGFVAAALVLLSTQTVSADGTELVGSIAELRDSTLQRTATDTGNNDRQSPKYSAYSFDEFGSRGSDTRSRLDLLP